MDSNGMRVWIVLVIAVAVLIASGCARAPDSGSPGPGSATPTRPRPLRGTPASVESPSPETVRSPSPSATPAIPVASGTAPPAAATETPAGSVAPQLVQVDSVEINMPQSSPGTLNVTLHGVFADDCTRLSSISQVTEGRTIKMIVLSDRIEERDCPTVPVPFEETVDLDLTELAEGTYELDVNGVTAAVEITAEMLLPADPWLDCPEISEGLLGYYNESDGYCFLYPQGFEADSPRPGTVAVLAPESTEIEESVRAGLTIRNEGAVDGRSLEEVAEDYLLALEAEGRVIERDQMSLGGKDAVVAILKPGLTLVRQVFALHGERVLVLTFGPVDDELPQAEEVEELWSAVKSSWTFVEPRPRSEDEEYSYEGWTVHNLDDLGVRLRAPSDWVLISGPGYYGLAPEDSEDPYLVSVAVAEDVPQEALTNTDALVDWVAQRLREEGKGGFLARTGVYGGFTGVEFTGLASACSDVYVPAYGRVIRMTLAARGCDSSGNVSVAEYDAIASALEFLEPS
jgi:hypothetical protein